MPLYMDIHTVDSETFSVEDVVKAHMEDLAIQERFGVIQLKYWVNVPAKTLFCLMSGPNIDACNQVHVESHGNTACNIIEVSDDEYNLFLGMGTHINDLAQTNEGEIDTGYRTILLVNVFDFTGNYKHYQDEIYRIIEKHDGVIVVRPDSDIMVNFIYAAQAILCAISIEKLLSSVKDNLEYTLAVASGRPVDEEGDLLFEETKRKLNSLSLCGHSNTLYIDKETKLLADKESKNAINWDLYSIVDEEDFTFLFSLDSILTEE